MSEVMHPVMGRGLRESTCRPSLGNVETIRAACRVVVRQVFCKSKKGHTCARGTLDYFS